jgi:2-oxoglutarate ferredoxin oxidoreductase subunit beta
MSQGNGHDEIKDLVAGAPAAATPATATLTKKDFESDQEVRWCPGCGDYAILRAAQQLFPTLGIPRENFVIVSGIGCSSRFPYYMNVYGFHGIHGRAPAIATGLKVSRPELSVWVITGDGDALSIGGNHLIHALRRNVDLKIVMFNNRIYGLTKGQYSPTSERGKVTKSTPFGSVEHLNPCRWRSGPGDVRGISVDVYTEHLKGILAAASKHRGSAFVEVYQNCNIFNDGAFDFMTPKSIRDDHQVALEHGKPLVFGKNLDKGIRLHGLEPEVVDLSAPGASRDDLLVPTRTPRIRRSRSCRRGSSRLRCRRRSASSARSNSRRSISMNDQIAAAIEKRGCGDLSCSTRAIICRQVKQRFVPLFAHRRRHVAARRLLITTRHDRHSPSRSRQAFYHLWARRLPSTKAISRAPTSWGSIRMPCRGCTGCSD